MKKVESKKHFFSLYFIKTKKRFHEELRTDRTQSYPWRRATGHGEVEPIRMHRGRYSGSYQRVKKRIYKIRRKMAQENVTKKPAGLNALFPLVWIKKS